MRFDIKILLRRIALYVGLILGLIAIYVGLVTFAARVPKGYVEKNLILASELLAKEDKYPSMYNPSNIAFYDNWSDSLVLNVMASQDCSRPLYSAMANNKRVSGDSVLWDCLLAAYGSPEGELVEYSNYWLGEIFYLKGLMCFISWTNIRYLLYFLASILQFVAAYFLYKKIDIKAALAFVIATVFFGLSFNAANVQASNELILMELGVIYACVLYAKNSEYINFLMLTILGSVTCFMGFMYAPMLQVGMVVISMVLVDRKAGLPAMKRTNRYIKNVFAWAMGYGFTALAKQVLALIVLGGQDGTAKLGGWSSASLGTKFIAFINPIKNIFFQQDNMSPTIIVCTLIAIYLVYLVINKNSLQKEELGSGALLILASFVFPYIWCVILVNGTTHGFYTQNYMPVLYAISYSLLKLIKEKKRA